MKPLDIAFQLFGHFTHAKMVRPTVWQFDGCDKFPGKSCILRFDQGLAEIFGTEDVNTPEQAFAISATLEPLDADYKAPHWPQPISPTEPAV